MTDSLLWNIATWFVPLVIAIVFHEVSHGLVANALGDPTARQRGRLSFNPVKHVDPFGTVLLPMILAVSGAPVFGWAKPVPVVSQRLRNPRYHMVLVALAGPGMNLLLAVVAAMLFAGLMAMKPQGLIGVFIIQNLLNFMVINVFLAIFNLIPMPPFDGGHVVEGLLPRRLAVHYSKLRRYGFPLLIILLLVVPMLFPDAHIVERTIGPPVSWIIRQLLGNSLG
ncbi:MAG: site-2 protease family protein [Pseudomonadota bacterium]|nr:site-2 protease family protein [Pseudomonadota bacterium]